MPEKPEVITVTNKLKPLLVGRTIKECNIYWDNIIEIPSSKEFIEKVVNQTINNITTRGKFIVFELNDYSLLIHLRMEGKFTFRKKGDYVSSHEHAEFILDDLRSFRFHDVRKFGKLYLINKDDTYKVKPLSELGLEYYDDKLTGKYLYESIQRKRLPIKTILLDQTIISGIGNIYDNEILFASEISPFRRGCDITEEECNKIIENTKIILNAAVKKGGTTIKSFTSSEGVHGLFQNELTVHGRYGCKCYKCGNQIKKDKIAGRGTYFCEICQK